MTQALALQVDGLRVEYATSGGPPVVAVSDLSMSIAAGEIHAVVGESGAGKSTVGHAILGILEPPGRAVSGSIQIAGKALDLVRGTAQGIVGGRDSGAVLQDPMTSLNPLFNVEVQIGEAMRHHLGLSRSEARARSLALLEAVGIPEPQRRLGHYPHQLSGGQRQRVVIAAALACEPRLIIAAEPTTALDVSGQAQILALLRTLAKDRGVGIMLVTHNMGVVAEIADRVTIMRRGVVVESGSVLDVLSRPQQDYSRDLIASVPPVAHRLERFATPDQATQKGAPARARIASARHEISGLDAGADTPLLQVRQLTVEFGGGSRWRPGARPPFRAVDEVSLTLSRGEILGLVGESGSGKSTIANAVAGLQPPTRGQVLLAGKPIKRSGYAASAMGLRRAIQMVFQDPYSSLNPRLRVSTTLCEPILFYRLADSQAQASDDMRTLLEAVGLDPSMAERFPHAFSGGQRQRVSVARALAARPALLICDEPTSSLDVSVQAQVLNLLKDLRDATGLAMLFISHDLAVVRQMCDRVVVLKSGRVCEEAATETLFEAPGHPYTRELMRLVPRLDAVHRRFGPEAA